MTELHLPYPPSANHIWVRAKKGMRKSDEYEQWLTVAGSLARGQKPKKVPGPYKISINAVRPDRRRRDLDNIIKPISDLLMKIGAVTDDSLCEMVCARWVSAGNGVYVRIEPAARED